MSKGVVLGAFLLILALVPTVSMTGAKVPKPPTPSDTRTVTFDGDITGTDTLTADSRGSGFRLYTPVGEGETTILTFEEERISDLWKNETDDETHDFTGIHYDGDLLIRIDERTGEAYIEYWFERYTQEDVDDGEIDPRYKDWYKYQLEASGKWDGDQSIITVDDASNERTSTICQLMWEASTKKSGKSATGLRTPQLWDGQLSFAIKIKP